MTAFTDEMDKLAAGIASKATGDAIALGDKIDAFKALTPYYALQLKNRDRPDEDDTLPTFDRFTRDIHAVSNPLPGVRIAGPNTEMINGEGEPGVRDRRRNGN